MKHLKWTILLFAVIIAATGCNDKKPATIGFNDSLLAESERVPDTTIYGRCGEGTAMHTLELITEKGDTVSYSLENGDTLADVQGGLLVGDRLAVIAGTDNDGNRYARKVLNLTTLLGKWISLDKNFEIQEDGVVISNVKEPKPYVTWKIYNGRLILSADTFDVYSLGADSLYLENDKGIYAYKRIKTEI